MSAEYTEKELEEYFTNKLTGTVTDTIEDAIKTELLAMAFGPNLAGANTH